MSTAVSSDPNASLRHGLYGDVEPAKDVSPHVWRLIALDRKTGKVLWDKVAHEGVPKTKRHPKSSQASPTPATDGTHVVVSFGSEGLYAYSVKGDLLWKQDLGVLNAGWFYDPDYEWGVASSPIIWKNLVIVQCDIQQNSFVAAFDVQDRQAGVADQPRRDPVVVDADRDRDGRPHRAGDAGHERDPRLRPGHRQGAVAPDRQLRGHRADADRRPGHGHRHQRLPRRAADLRDQAGRPRRPHARRRRHQLGVHRLEHEARRPVHADAGRLRRPALRRARTTARWRRYDAKTGERLYQERLGGKGGAFSASPVAADGKIYLTSEDGDVFVVKAGRTYELLATNPVGEVLMATPAIADGVLYIRGMKHVIAIAAPKAAAIVAPKPAQPAKADPAVGSR